MEFDSGTTGTGMAAASGGFKFGAALRLAARAALAPSRDNQFIVTYY